MNPRDNSRQKKVLAATLCAAAVVCLILYQALGHKGFDWDLFISSVRALDWSWLALAIGCSYATYGVRALRWGVLLRPLRPHARFSGLLSATVIGFSAVTALGRPAEMVRPYLIAANEHVPFSSQVAAWVVERIYDVLVALAVFGFALSQVDASMEYLGPALSWILRVGGWAIGLGASLCLALLLAMKYRSEQIHRWILRTLRFLRDSHFRRIEKVASGFADGARCARSVSGMLLTMGYTLAEWLLVAACYACVLRAFGTSIELNTVDVLVLMGFVSFGSLVQLPAVGGGAQVTAVLVLTEIFGVPIEAATVLALFLWMISFVAILPVGAVLALREGLTWTRLREAERGIAS